MSRPPTEIQLSLEPSERFQLIDVADRVRQRDGDFFQRYPKSAFCSFHTTAGYLEQRLCARLGHSDDRLGRFVGLFRQIFPKGAGYYHDRMELREELTEAEKECEPVNADSHLAFMGAGLRNLTTYEPDGRHPVYFIDLDGVNGDLRRTRRTTVLGYTGEERVYHGTFRISVSKDHQVDSFNLKKEEHGLFPHVAGLLDEFDLRQGRVDIRLAPGEHDAGLTVNEFETLLVRNDLPAAMRSPLRYTLRRGKELLRHPGTIPEKAREYAVYDLLHLYNEVMDVLGVGRSVADRLLTRLAGPAYRLFRLKRRVSFLVSEDPETGGGRIRQGTYQSPILIQHRAPDTGSRELEIAVWRFV